MGSLLYTSPSANNGLYSNGPHCLILTSTSFYGKGFVFETYPPTIFCNIVNVLILLLGLSDMVRWGERGFGLSIFMANLKLL